MKDVYFLLANQLREIEYRLTAKILKNKQHSPRWEVTKVKDERIVDELAEIKSLIFTLERLAGTDQQETTDFFVPNQEGVNNGR